MEVRSAAGSDNFARLSNDLIAYRSSESAEAEVNGALSPLSHHHRMHPLIYDGRYPTSTNSNGRTGHDVSSKAATMRYDRRYTTGGGGGGGGAMDPGIGGGGGDSVRLRPQLLQGQEARNAAPVPVSSGSVSVYSSSSRREQNRPTASGEVRSSCLVKSKSGFGFTMADAPTGHVVKLMAEPLGHGQLQPGDVIVMVDGVDVRRQSHENTVTMLKSYPPGSTVVFSYIRPNGNRNPSHPRPHSALPRSSLYSSPSTFLPVNGGGAGMDKMGMTEEENILNHRTINHRLPTTEVNPGGLNGSKAPSAAAGSSHHSRTVSFDSSTDTSDAAMKTRTNSSRDGETTTTTKGRRNDSRRLTGILRRAVGPRRRGSTPVVEETQRSQRLMVDPTASVSTLNFSGTPDFIPASQYRPSISTGEYAELVEEYRMPMDVVDGRTSAGYAVDRSQQPSRSNSSEATHGLFRSVGPSSVSSRDQWSEASNDRRTSSFTAESKGHQSKTSTSRMSFDNDNRLQQMTIGSRPPQPPPQYPSQSLRRSANGRRDSGVRKQSGDVNLKGGSSVIESVDPSSVFNADIHRGSRGFGFSIRGGKEFNGMPLLVLDIAEGGPADMDGRMKNGDEILSINDFSTRDMTHERAIELIQNACSPISLVMKRSIASNAKRQSRPAKVGDAGQTRRQP